MRCEVNIRHILARARLEAFTPNLAMSLNNLAAMLSDLGRREEAVAIRDDSKRVLDETSFGAEVPSGSAAATTASSSRVRPSNEFVPHEAEQQTARR
jgi:hypothetical protein